jgi:hypothetical protein
MAVLDVFQLRQQIQEAIVAVKRPSEEVRKKENRSDSHEAV